MINVYSGSRFDLQRDAGVEVHKLGEYLDEDAPKRLLAASGEGAKLILRQLCMVALLDDYMRYSLLDDVVTRKKQRVGRALRKAGLVDTPATKEIWRNQQTYRDYFPEKKAA